MDKVDLSGALMVLMLSYSFFSAVRTLMNSAHQALTGVAATHSISQILDIDTTRPYQENVTKIDDEGIVLEHVSFSYDNKKEVLKDISLHIEPGKMIAVVGKSGCGKSTIASLLMRFYDIEQGNMYLDGKNYISYLPNELRKQIVMVPQKVNLFTGTIEENLRITSPDATLDQLYDALKDSKLYDWVMSLPEGIHSNIGESGSKLSGGQRQKIGIARALLKKAPYIIFDEATSSVDQQSENEIWQCIFSLVPKRTAIVISHRLSTIQKADTIVVLDGGQIKQIGSHLELINQDGLYQYLCKQQEELEMMGGMNHE